MRRCGVPRELLLNDRVPDSRLEPSGLRGAAYVDNFATFSHDPIIARETTQRIYDAATAAGLPRHEVSDPTEPQDFTGMHFNGQRGRVQVTTKRLWRLRLGIEGALAHGRCPGEQLRRLLGHITYACLLRREMLSILSSCYAFISSKGPASGVLWSSVRRELKWISSLLPLVYTNTWREWSPRLHVGDASDDGFGVCELMTDVATTSSLGRTSERWRFRTEDAIAARQHALRQVPADLLHRCPDTVRAMQLHSPDVCIMNEPAPAASEKEGAFMEVPAALLLDEAWHVCFWGQWRESLNILRGEGRAAIMCARHALRSAHELGRRHTVLCDNLPLVLALSKGRANSLHLLQTCRELCALSLFS